MTKEDIIKPENLVAKKTDSDERQSHAYCPDAVMAWFTN